MIYIFIFERKCKSFCKTFFTILNLQKANEIQKTLRANSPPISIFLALLKFEYLGTCSALNSVSRNLNGDVQVSSSDLTMSTITK